MLGFVARIAVDGAPTPTVTGTQTGQITLIFTWSSDEVRAEFDRSSCSVAATIGQTSHSFFTGREAEMPTWTVDVVRRCLRGLDGDASTQLITRTAISGDERSRPGVPDDPMDYDSLRELVNEVRAEYVARKRSAHDDRERRRWFDASVKLQDQLQEVDPFDAAQVSALRGELVETLRTLRS
ncbi:hypothetical protein SAMN06264364_1158 [Quadrisphaera granulorum]|uniref:Uncharacterized protein n=1 Tax=Quadrisphaera granulorum TaxID=317664 RepID=A0A316A517_9ACTN|nr:hypothetical protein [Quadrisphaera granulorum]PWJ52991.1 hypothetical protein BXY45_1158 [Quadrisphaera granulorum]SZE97156.1 hypothetical protein SAMN06264364_1158 [Quadrisphaera granulorum]